MNAVVDLSDTTLDVLHFELQALRPGDTVSYPHGANAEFLRRLREAVALKRLAGQVRLVAREPGRRHL